MTSVDVFGRPTKKSEFIIKIVSNGGLNLINDYLKIKLDRNSSNILSLSANGLMGHGLRYPLTFDFNVSNKRIYFLKDPIDPQDAVTKRYVDKITRNVLKYPLTQDFNANGFSITNLIVNQPLNAQDAVPKRYVDEVMFYANTEVSDVYMKKTGTDVNLDMNGKRIIGLDQTYPVSDNSQVVSWYQVYKFVTDSFKENNNYIDNKIIIRYCVKNNVGFIPHLYGTKNKKGFIVTASSFLNDNTKPKSIFNESGHEWSTAGMTERSWIQVQLPFKVSIWKFTIAGKLSNSEMLNDIVNTERWHDWSLEGSNDNIIWVKLHNAYRDYIGPVIKTYILDPPSDSFSYYRFYGLRGESDNPGLSHLQIYTVDEIMFKN